MPRVMPGVLQLSIIIDELGKVSDGALLIYGELLWCIIRQQGEKWPHFQLTMLASSV